MQPPARATDEPTTYMHSTAGGGPTPDGVAPQVALVTGAARGIGHEVAAQLVERGWLVFLGARTAERAAEAVSGLAARLGARATNVVGASGLRPLALDVTDAASIDAAVDAIAIGVGRLDVLVNNAAAYADWTETARTADLSTARAVLDTNLFGAWRVTQSCLPLLARGARSGRPARVVMVASAAGSHGEARFGLTTGAGAASYAVSKAALLALTAKFAVAMRDAHVLVNAVDPGLTATAPGMEAMGARPVADGAAGVVWAATLDGSGPTGGFFRDGVPLPW